MSLSKHTRSIVDSLEIHIVLLLAGVCVCVCVLKTLAAQMFLIAVGRVAGFYTEPHHCSTLHAPSGSDQARLVLQPFGDSDGRLRGALAEVF